MSITASLKEKNENGIYGSSMGGTTFQWKSLSPSSDRLADGGESTISVTAFSECMWAPLSCNISVRDRFVKAASTTSLFLENQTPNSQQNMYVNAKFPFEFNPLAVLVEWVRDASFINKLRVRSHRGV